MGATIGCIVLSKSLATDALYVVFSLKVVNTAFLFAWQFMLRVLTLYHMRKTV